MARRILHRRELIDLGYWLTDREKLALGSARSRGLVPVSSCTSASTLLTKLLMRHPVETCGDGSLEFGSNPAGTSKNKISRIAG